MRSPVVVRTGLLLCLCIAAVWLCGCGGGVEKPPAGRLYGSVTAKGKPLTNAVIHFYSPKTGAVANAELGNDGSFQVAYPVQVGTYSVYVTPPEVAGKADGVTPDPEPIDNPNIPQKYRTAATSGLTFEVKEGDNNFAEDLTD